MKLDILAIAAHPDDAELSCGGTLIAHVEQGFKTGILDLTRGELGTRGTPEIRLKESREAARIMGIHVRENLNFSDGYFHNDDEHRRKLMEKIRKYRPEVILTNPPKERHPDHVRTAELVRETCFLSGLQRIVSRDENNRNQKPWSPRALYYFIQFYSLEADFSVDITPYIDRKMEAIRAHHSQFHDPRTGKYETRFFDIIKSRWVLAGSEAGFEAAEGFVASRCPGIKNLLDLY